MILYFHYFHPLNFHKRKYTGLHWASLLGYTKVIELLVIKGADVNAKDIVTYPL